MIKVFVGTEPNQRRAERVLEYSIRKHTTSDVDITFMRSGDPGWDDWDGHGPTQFTLFRFAIPELMGFEGTAIYLDCDMLVLDDISKLADQARMQRWCKNSDPQGDCVSVIDCQAVKAVGWPAIEVLKLGALRKWDLRHRLNMVISNTIPREWNHCDRYEPKYTKLIHFTALDTQPWHPEPGREYGIHPDAAAEAKWLEYEREMIDAETT